MNNHTKRCWVLDDEWGGYPRRLWFPALEAAGYTVEKFSKASPFVQQVKARAPCSSGDIALLDISLDESAPPELGTHSRAVQHALSIKGLFFPFSGQAVGLWLWQQRKSLRLPYAYISSHPGLFMDGVEVSGSDPEFGFNRASSSDWFPLMCERGKEGNIVVHFEAVMTRWQEGGWLPCSGDLP